MLVLNKVECFLHRGWEEGGGGGVRRKVGEEGLREMWGRRGRGRSVCFLLCWF